MFNSDEQKILEIARGPGGPYSVDGLAKFMCQDYRSHGLSPDTRGIKGKIHGLIGKGTMRINDKGYVIIR